MAHWKPLLARELDICERWRFGGVVVFALLLTCGRGPEALGQGDVSGLAAPVVTSTTPYNIHVVAAEDFLNRFVARDEVEPGQVDDFVFGAKVDGEQWTSTQLRLDLRPSVESAYAAFVLTGQVQSRTVGRTDQGAVQTVGNQEFEATKDVFFNGRVFSTRHATVRARSSNQPVAASTSLDGTFLARLGQKIAMSRAEQQRPQTEAYARNKVAERVYPPFDTRIDEQLANANQQLTEQLVSRLQQANLLPVLERTMTTDFHLHHSALLVTPVDAGPFPVPRVAIAEPHGVSLYVQESLLNSLVDRLELRGKKTTDRELKAIFDRAENMFGGQPDEPPPLPPANPGLALPGLGMNVATEIEFDRVDPLRFHFVQEQLLVEIRATFKPAGQALLPPLRISVPLQLRDEGATWHLVRGRVEIASTSGTPLPQVAENLIRQAIESDVRTARFPKLLPIPNWPAGLPALQLSSVRAADGWLAVSFD